MNLTMNNSNSDNPNTNSKKEYLTSICAGLWQIVQTSIMMTLWKLFEKLIKVDHLEEVNVKKWIQKILKKLLKKKQVYEYKRY